MVITYKNVRVILKYLVISICIKDQAMKNHGETKEIVGAQPINIGLKSQ